MLNKHRVTLMDSDWNVIVPILKVKHVPSVGELIYLNKDKIYYNVISVIHNISKKCDIFIIVEIYDKKN